MTDFLSREAALAPAERPRKEAPFRNGKILLQGLSVAEYDEFQASSMIPNGQGGQMTNLRGLRARLLVRCAIKPDGSLFFTDPAADALAISNLPTRDVEAAYAVAMEMNSITVADLRELEKNSARGPSGDSSS